MDYQLSKGRSTQNISLDPNEARALLWLALQKYPAPDGKTPRRGAISWVITDLLREKMRAEIGRDWEAVLAAEVEREAVPA